MEEEKKEPTLEELYAPPTSTDKPRLDKKRKITAGFVMDCVFTGLVLLGALLYSASQPMFSSFENLAGWLAFSGFTLFALSPLVAFPIRFVTALIAIPTRRASLMEVYSFAVYVATWLFFFISWMKHTGWDMLMSV